MIINVWDKKGSTIGSVDVGIDSIPMYVLIDNRLFMYYSIFGSYTEIEVFNTKFIL